MGGNDAGTSFPHAGEDGKLPFGSKIVNFVRDRTQPSGLATVGYDDEAVRRSVALSKGRRLVDWQTTRDLAPLIGHKISYGCLHADDWSSVPFPRMPNVSLEPRRETSLWTTSSAASSAASSSTATGLLDRPAALQLPVRRQTFWEIEKGKVRDAARRGLQSRNDRLLAPCDALGVQATYRLGGSFNDGKGEPGQSNAVSHGCPIARFRRVNVLNTSGQRA